MQSVWVCECVRMKSLHILIYVIQSSRELFPANGTIYQCTAGFIFPRGEMGSTKLHPLSKRCHKRIAYRNLLDSRVNQLQNYLSNKVILYAFILKLLKILGLTHIPEIWPKYLKLNMLVEELLCLAENFSALSFCLTLSRCLHDMK